MLNSRLFIAYIPQLFISIAFLSLSFIILRKKRDRLSVSLSIPFILISLSFIVNLIYLPLNLNPQVYILHFIAVYFLFLSLIFFVVFNLNLLYFRTESKLKTDVVLIIVYGILLFIILLLPKGITINENTSWMPRWSWSLFLVLGLFIISFVGIPQIILSVKIYNKFKDNALKKRIKFYFVGLFGLTINLMGILLYNTWDNSVFKTIWPFLSLIAIFFGLCIYYGIGRQP